MAQAAFSDKLQALQARDKLLRESRHRQTDIETATAVTGSCPDMCPEIERLFRTETNQLSALEMSDGFADPDAMVKEYRRAGADQSEPLAHELRPGPVLSRTMDYLMCNVMDRVRDDGAIRNEWYDFLWSRTRAIRKDITQQHLCDRLSVELMEKCTRFHIHCSAVLVEEDTTIFDPKINDENLRKCMQSLKDFYHDLSVSHNVSCPNEAEFRAYDILLNLGDGDIQREIKHLRPEIRDSPQVLFARSAYVALTMNNFVQFFHLVRQTSYLNACLMHRFFTPVRIHAVRLMRRAYTTPKSVQPFPVADFVRQLGFDDEKQVAVLCECLFVTIENGNIYLTRDDGEVREAPSVPPLRSTALVESKRSTSCGQVVNGGPLPENPYRKYGVHSSFDEAGNLKANALTSLTPEKAPVNMFSTIPVQSIASPAIQPPPLFSFPPAMTSSDPLPSGFSFQGQKSKLDQMSSFMFAPPVEPKEPEISDTKIEELAEMFSRDAIDEYVATALVACARRGYAEGQRLRDQEKQQELCVEQLSERLIATVADPMVRSMFQTEYEKQLQEAAIVTFRRRVVDVSKELYDSILEQAANEVVREIAVDVYKAAQKVMFQKISQSLAEKLLEEICDRQSKEIIGEAVLEARQRQERLIQKHVAARRKKLELKYFRLWLTRYRKEKKLRYLKRTFPACSLEAGSPAVIAVSVESKKRAVTRGSSGDRKTKKRKSVPPVTATPVRRSPRSSTQAIMAKIRQDIQIAGDQSPVGKMNLLNSKLNQEKENGDRSEQTAATVARAFAHTEDSFV